MKITLLLLLSLASLAAQTTSVPDAFDVETETIPTLKAHLQTSYLEEADTDANEVVSNAEAIAWFSGKRQMVVDVLQRKAIEAAVVAYRADQTLTTLPASTRAILDALIAAENAWAAEQDRLMSLP